MTTVDIEKLAQLISRTDINGNDKVRWLTDFISGRELQQQEQDKNNFSPDDVRDILKAIYKNKQQERIYSEEDMNDYANYRLLIKKSLSPKEWFEQFKKK
jgi:hypothetical protein